MGAMRAKRIGGGLLLLVALAGVAHVRASPPESGPGRFLVIADIHFDPFYDGALFPQLAAAPAERWAEIFAGSRPAGFSPVHTDTNYALLGSSLDDARARLPRPDFILYPGDFLAHGWLAKYDRLAGASHTADPGAYRAFTAKTIAFLAGEFRKRFPDVPVLPTLGNEDSYCGDYQVEPAGPFLAMFADTWAPLLGPGADRDAFRASFARGGYYSMPLPGVRGHRLVVLNSVFLSVNYDNACGSDTQTPALGQLRWLARTLRAAEEAGEKVWLLMHVPPGINSFSSVGSMKRGDDPVMFWQPELQSRFLKLARRRRAILSVVFAGHTHMDDFRVVAFRDEPALLVKIAPAVSPIFGNNPGYQVYEYDRATGALIDYRTYYLTNLATAGRDGTPAIWKDEYSYTATYDRPLNARGVARLAGALESDANLQRDYTTFYGVSAPPEFTPADFPIYRAAIENLTPSRLQDAVQETHPPPMSPPHPDRPPGRPVVMPQSARTGVSDR